VAAPRLRITRSTTMTTNNATDTSTEDAAREAEFLDLLAQVWPDDREAVLALLAAIPGQATS
jgi:hypothetical protein